MRIFFICGSLEPGRDGVGDYVRQLAKELQNQGHQVAAAAIYDEHIVSGFIKGGTNHTNDNDFRSIRISRACNIEDRFRSANEFLKEFDPEWVSLQFVPYSFYNKGFPFFLPAYLKNLTEKRKVHVMIHETWSGKKKGFHPTSVVTSYLQRNLLKRILKSLKPALIHTHLPGYQEVLANLNFETKCLPLFSNIKILQGIEKTNDKMIIGFFSQVECSKSILLFLSFLGRKALNNKIPVEIMLIGGNYSKMKQFGEFVEQVTYFKNKVTYTGFLSANEISKAIQHCSLAVTPVPRHALGKSGSVAAFLEHGIPVAAPVVGVNNNENKIGFFSAALQATIITNPEVVALGKVKEELIRVKGEISLKKVAYTFIGDIENCR